MAVCREPEQSITTPPTVSETCQFGVSPGHLAPREPAPHGEPAFPKTVGFDLDVEATADLLWLYRFVGGVAVGGGGFRPMPAETVSRCS